MKPVFKEELHYLGIDNKYEDLLWVNLRCFYGFYKNKKVRFGRDIKNLPTEINGLLSHKEVATLHYNETTKIKVNQSRNDFLQHDKSPYSRKIVFVSGGKDSTVLSHMLKDIDGLEVLFANSSNETHHTYRYINETYGSDISIINPQEGFYQYIKRMGVVPSRLNRMCCSVFKEGIIEKNLDKKEKILHICGIRRSESNGRKGYEKIRKGKWSKKASMNWDMYLPILDFDDMDIWSYIIYNEIDFNKLYRFGYNRVGCAMCPYRQDYELKLNDRFLKFYSDRWKRIIGDIFIDKGLHVNVNSTVSQFTEGGWRGGVFQKELNLDAVNEFAEYNELSYDTSSAFFNKTYCDCGARLNRNIIALNLKMYGINTISRKCIKCMSEDINVTHEELYEEINKHKNNGCKLF